MATIYFYAPLLSFLFVMIALAARVASDELKGHARKHLLFQAASFVLILSQIAFVQPDAWRTIAGLVAQLLHLFYFYRTTRRIRHLKYIDDPRRFPPRDPKLRSSIPGVLSPIPLRCEPLLAQFAVNTGVGFGFLILLVLIGFLCPDPRQEPHEAIFFPWYIYVLAIPTVSAVLGALLTLVGMGRLRDVEIDSEELRMVFRFTGRVLPLRFDEILYAYRFEFRNTTSIVIGYENTKGFGVIAVSAPPFWAADLGKLREALSLRGLLLMR